MLSALIDGAKRPGLCLAGGSSIGNPIIQKNFSKVTSLYYRDIFILANLTACGDQHQAIIWEQFMDDFPVTKDL